MEFVQEAALNDISDDFSATFCHSYKVSADAAGTLYLLPEHARVNTSNKDVITFIKPSDVSSMYMLKGSELDISVCRTFHEHKKYENYYEMILIKGSSEMKNYKRNHHCRSCKIINIPTCQSQHDSEGKLHYAVQSNDFYYLTFRGHFDSHSPNDLDKLDFNCTIERTHFDTRSAHTKCNISRNSYCQFDLPWQSNEDIVVKFSDFRLDSQINTECQIRLVFWLCIFVGLPVLTVLPITMLLAFFLCRVRKRTFSAVERQAQVKRKRAQDKHTLVHSEVIPDDGDGTTIQTDE
ncbi:hypothetical protein Btru_023350 [Bulinus truncatus]|nr:hypothetical protein Btru_023350 [Bulinus truncatus]